MKTKLEVLADAIADQMIEIVDNRPQDYFETTDFEALFEKCFDRMIDQALSESEYVEKYEEIEKMEEIKNAIEVLEALIYDAKIEAEYSLDIQSNPSKYYGSVHDYD